MDCWPKSPAKQDEPVAHPFVGDQVANLIKPGKGDLSDWIELMEAVEALCPVWPAKERRSDGIYLL
jgi:hypothetical protein